MHEPPRPLTALRRTYEGEPLDEANVSSSPFQQFERWFGAARTLEVDPSAMAVATVDGDGRPSVRMVLLKGLDDRGFVFFTNYESRKGRDLLVNPNASLLFYWASLTRQVRVDGVVERTTAEESDEYFATRPPESRLAAVISPQSRSLENRERLDELFAEALARFPDANVPRPAFWGGYRLIPRSFEFWQGRPHRLHDRLRYERDETGTWSLIRLAP